MAQINSSFDLIDFIFSARDIMTWNSITTYEKTKYVYMLNRTMGIGFPMQAMIMNMIKTDALGVTETWRIITQRFYGNKVPRFIYTKAERNDKKSNPLVGIPKECVDFWCEKHECGDREFYSLLELHPEPLLEELQYIKDNFYEKPKKTEDDE